MIRYKKIGVRCRVYIWISLISLPESEIVILPFVFVYEKLFKRVQFVIVHFFLLQVFNH